MHRDNLVRVLCDSIDIADEKVNLYECGESPSNEYGDEDVNELFKRTFETDSLQKDVFYEAYLSGSNKPFYSSKTLPTNDELLFQLKNTRQGDPMKIVSWVVVLSLILYVILRSV